MKTLMPTNSKNVVSTSYSQPFKVISSFKPSGDQPVAIKKLIEGINNGEGEQILYT